MRPGWVGKARQTARKVPLAHRIKRRTMAAGGDLEWREKQGGVEDHCSPDTPGVQSATSQALVCTRTSFTQVAGVGGVTAYFPHLKQSCQHRFLLILLSNEVFFQELDCIYLRST